MPEDTNNGAGGGTNNNNGGGNGGGTGPTKTDTQNTTPVDFSKVGDEDFQKVFDDPRVWNHPRFKGLNQRAKLADKYEAEKAEGEKKRLEEEGKWKELAALKEKEATEAKAQVTIAKIDNKLQIAAAKAGTQDLEAVLKLVDRANIKVDETTGEITGVDEAINALLTAKPYLKGDGTVTLGGGTNPGDGGNKGAKRFKLSQLQDPKFYQDNIADIQQAYKNGLVEDDMTSRPAGR